MDWLRRFDRYGIGFLIGLVAPALFCYAYIERFNLWSIVRAFDWMGNPVMTQLLLLAVFPDLALLFLFYTTDTWRLSKGILLGAMPYMLGAILLTL